MWCPEGPAGLCSVWICSFLRSKVDANNYMIPETCLVNSSWWETRNVVNGWFDIPANKEKGPGNSDSFSILFKPHFVPYNIYNVKSLLNSNPIQPNAMYQQFTLRSTSLQTSRSVFCVPSACGVGLESRAEFYFHLYNGHSCHSLEIQEKTVLREGSEMHS